MNIHGIFSIVLVGLLSFFDFGYYRIFEAALYYSPNSFFTKEEQDKMLEKGSWRSSGTPYSWWLLPL